MPATSITPSLITSVILAGGKGSRYQGQDKGLLPFNNHTFVTQLIHAFQSQVADFIISANRHLDHYQQFGYRVVTDTQAAYLGPLAGIAAALSVVTTPYAFVIACDMPLLDRRCLARLITTLEQQQSDVCYAHDGKQAQPLCALLKTNLAPSLDAQLASGNYKLTAWLNNQQYSIADCRQLSLLFSNINTQHDHYQLLRQSA